MQLQGSLAGMDSRILVDTGATHSFIKKEAAPKQDGKEANKFKGGTFEMVSGATGSIQGIMKARLRGGRMHCHQDLYVVEQILRGVDCILGNDCCKERNVHVQRVLSRLREERETICRTLKVCIVSKEANILGPYSVQGGLQVTPDRMKAIQDCKVPSNVHKVRSFLGLASFFGELIKDFASTASPLTDLPKKDAVWNWTARCRMPLTASERH